MSEVEVQDSEELLTDDEAIEGRKGHYVGLIWKNQMIQCGTHDIFTEERDG